VAALKRHRLFPFSDYQADDEQYMLLEMYWTYLFKAATHGNINRSWGAWNPPDPTHEGNPIFSAKNEAEGRAVRVIQHPESFAPGTPMPKGYFPFQAFLSYAPEDLTKFELQILELCFIADLSLESENRCRQFWRFFCIDRLSEAEMEQKIRQFEISVGMPAVPEGFES